MKANLKGLDFQKLMIEHGEKFGLGLVAVISLVVVMMMSRWGTYDKTTPEELVKRAAAEAQNLQQSRWPEEKRQEFAQNDNIVQNSQMMLADLDVDQLGVGYGPGKDLIFKPNRRREPIDEPEWLIVEEPIADPVRVFIETTPTLMSEDGLDPLAAANGTANQPAGDEPVIRRKNRGGLAGLPMPMGDAGFGAGGGHGAAEALPMTLPMPMAAGGHGADAGLGSDMGPGAGMGGGMASSLSGEGVRFVAVRGVFPFRRQLQNIIDALNDRERVPSPPSSLLEVLDFEIERQTAQAGADPWAGPWEKLALEHSVEVLKKAAEFEEIVDPGITTPRITSPLPMRLMGVWGEEVSHPRVRNFHMTPEGKELAKLIDAKAAELAEQREQMAQGQSQELEPGGFADIAYNLQQGRQQMAGMDSSMLMQQMMSGMDMDQTVMQQMSGQIKKQLDVSLSAAGQLLLFRYLDFTVEPGNAYRYRVRVKLANPNHPDRTGRTDETRTPTVSQGTIRWTNWSQPTPPVHVEHDAQYYLTRVKGPTGPRDAGAVVDIFQWLPESGTTAKGTLELTLGQFVGGTAKTKLVKPEISVETTDVEFSTKDVLIDLSDGSEKVDPGEFADLGVNSRTLELVDEAVVLNEYGELEELDPLKGAGSRTRIEKWVADVQDAFKDFEQKAGAGAGGDPMGDGEMMDDTFQQMMMEGYGLMEGGDPMGMGDGGNTRSRRGAASSRGSLKRRSSRGGGGTDYD
ncbi:MAG: hypothetical protein KY476_12355 [Planctomycetes bacterium]|nr:hypothetical protein [Planctomycetota bacterium]